MLPKLRVNAVVRVLVIKKLFSEIDKLCGMFKTSNRGSFEAFIGGIFYYNRNMYPERPTKHDFRRILDIILARGFPWCVGSWYYQHYA